MKTEEDEGLSPDLQWRERERWRKEKWKRASGERSLGRERKAVFGDKRTFTVVMALHV